MNYAMDIAVKTIGWFLAIIGIGFICKLIYYVFMFGWGVI